jgi:hypothetical protein
VHHRGGDRIEQQIRARIEGDPAAVDLDPMLADGPLQQPLERRRIDGVGTLALQAGDHGTIRAVAATGPGQRAEQRHADVLHTRERAVGPQGVDEGLRRAHGPDRVRRGRPDTDLEQIEGADHGFISYSRATSRSNCCT